MAANVPMMDIGSARLGIDRKSTRLNFSHLVISYAVFCLKKKQEVRQGEHPGRQRRARARRHVRRVPPPVGVTRGRVHAEARDTALFWRRDFFFFLISGRPWSSPLSPRRPFCE